VYLGDDDAELERILRAEYFAAQIVQDDGTLAGWLGKLVTHLDGRQPHLDLPLDVRATAFQCRVWEELRRIPYGDTRSYGDIAAALGQPDAVRAVGSACAANPVSIIVPCHRVLRSDGDLGGYRWGLARKRALLERERREAQRR
jgi:AraC family transcriptional regulator of adaptative response/methylated-DNA-[protein]-cysteine methyltransferase